MKKVRNGILAINGGSSSIKFALFERVPRLVKILHGKIERIGTPEATFCMDDGRPAGRVQSKISVKDGTAAAEILVNGLQERLQLGDIAGVGHRLVHGGPAYGPQKISPRLLQKLRKLRSFDPEHLPAELCLIAAIERRLSGIPQVACFDTAFHHDLPRVAQLLAIPRAYQAKGLRRYGFHGLSYEYLMGELARIDGAEAASGRVILAHLGNGASLAAVRDGKPVDTSMGFTPAAGLPMDSRSGDLDPGLVRFLFQNEGFDADRFNRFVNFECGLLGVSETSGDMRELLRREGSDSRAADAVALFCYQAKKWIGAFAAALGGVDTLVFTGGIGENSPAVRARICSGLEFLGINLADAKNNANAALISAPGRPVVVRVIHTDEEIVIARSTCRVLGLEA